MSTPVPADLVLENIGELLTMEPGLGEGPLGLIRQAAVAVADGRIAWVGPQQDLEAAILPREDLERLDVAGRILLPGLVDCHTHLVFGGGRELEFDMRLAGATYQDIAAAGGGIIRTMRATRDADFDTLLELGLRRLTAMLHQGVTTVEVKSGYGLSLEAELKILEVVKGLEQSQPCRLLPTFLGAHTVPIEFKGQREKYLELVINEMLPRVATDGLAVFCDVFCEQGVFSVEESRRVLLAAKALGLKPKVHAEQLTAFGGAALAAELGAISADHLEHADEASLRAMAQAGTVAVLLPGATFFLGQPFPSVAPMRQAGVRIAVATDFNPGSSPTLNLPLVGTIGAVRMGLSVAETLRGMTVEAAAALDLSDEVGRVAPGLAADLAVFNLTDHRTLLYRFGENHCAMVLKDGQVVVP